MGVRQEGARRHWGRYAYLVRGGGGGIAREALANVLRRRRFATLLAERQIIVVVLQRCLGRRDLAGLEGDRIARFEVVGSHTRKV